MFLPTPLRSVTRVTLDILNHLNGKVHVRFTLGWKQCLLSPVCVFLPTPLRSVTRVTLNIFYHFSHLGSLLLFVPHF